MACKSHPDVNSENYNTMLQSLLPNTIPEISVDRLARHTGRVTVLDARSPKEYEVSRIRGALRVGFAPFDLTAVAPIPKNSLVVVYCSVGYRSGKIVQKLKAMAFTNVFNLYGGLFEWVNQGHPVVNESGPVRSVHICSKKWAIWLNDDKNITKVGEDS